MESDWRWNLFDQGLSCRNCPSGLSHYGSTQLIAKLVTPKLQFGVLYEYTALFEKWDGTRIAALSFNYEPNGWVLAQDVSQPVPAPTFPWYPVLPDH